MMKRLSIYSCIMSLILLVGCGGGGGGGGSSDNGYSGETSGEEQRHNTNLSNLMIADFSLNPVFEASILAYSVEVPNATAELTLTPTAAEEGASIIVNGVDVSSGTPSPAIELSVGANTIPIMVKAAGSATTKTYTVNVIRQGAKVFLDGVFNQSDWNHTVYTEGNGGIQSYVQICPGIIPDPDPFLSISNVVNTPSSTSKAGVWGVFLKTGATYDPSLEGAIASIDYSEEAYGFSGFGVGQASRMVVKQGEKLYLQGDFFPTYYSTWTKQGRTGLTAGDFWFFDTARANFISTINPDFSSTGAEITFGFCRANNTDVGQPGYTIICYIDDWQVTVHYRPADK